MHVSGPVAESVLLLENIGTAVLVGPDQLASLHKLLLDAAHILGMDPVPDLYVRQASLCPGWHLQPLFDRG